jgi:gamma-glutamyl-gamma-aminobutyrate hydrolase PuuD
MDVFVAPARGEWERKAYEDWLIENGFNPITLEPKPQHINKPLILCGGADIGKNLVRDSLEFAWIESALIHKQPIIGVCRGMQILNVWFGGKVENLPEPLVEIHRLDEFEDDADHTERVSQFHLVKNSVGGLLNVNSRHHQYCSEVADNFNVIYRSLENGLPEAIMDIKRQIYAVQWHPERGESDNNEFPLNFLKKS